MAISSSLSLSVFLAITREGYLRCAFSAAYRRFVCLRCFRSHKLLEMDVVAGCPLCSGACKALVVVEMAIVLSVIFGCAYTVCTCIEKKYTMLAALYVAFKEEIYFDMFFKKYIFNLPFFRNCRMQLFFFLWKEKFPVGLVSWLILWHSDDIYGSTLAIFIFYLGVLLLLLLSFFYLTFISE